uniref:Uncharacterized protein n=1 Tax=Rhizophora mucronata TaxID=61149 RepID=A0A2P2P1B1_RHIMU
MISGTLIRLDANGNESGRLFYYLLLLLFVTFLWLKSLSRFPVKM